MRQISANNGELSVASTQPQEVVVALRPREISVIMTALRHTSGTESSIAHSLVNNGGKPVSSTEAENLFGLFCDSVALVNRQSPTT